MQSRSSAQIKIHRVPLAVARNVSSRHTAGIALAPAASLQICNLADSFLSLWAAPISKKQKIQNEPIEYENILESSA
jgi:hypothetical protein